MNFNELFETAYSQNLHHEPHKFVQFYDHNRILIEGQNIFENPIIYDRITRLISDYAISLIHLDNHTKALPEIEKAIKLFKEHPDHQGKNLFELKYFEILIFDRAIVNYYSKRYKLARKDLIALTKRFPNNEKYRNWLRAAKSYRLVNFEKAFYFALAVTLIANTFLEDLPPTFNTIKNIVLASILLTVIGIQFIKWRNKKTT